MNMYQTEAPPVEVVAGAAAEQAAPKKGKKAKVAGAAALAAILALSSTFAWTSFSQEATNEFRAEANAGGRLHDDFSFTQEVKNKDIYVENFTSEEDGAPIFARVQLKEYLEIGARAGQPETDDPAAKGVVRYPESATMDDTSAWTVYTPADTSSIYRERFAWSEGGSSTFMPTFNKNKDSLEADINGSYRDPDGPYTNYTAYTDGQTLEGSAIYDADDNAIDEGDQGVEDVNFTTATETHTAKATGTATVMSMAEWIAAGSQPGPYWVYDTDGWAYWAQAIQPGEATGLLLDNVDLKAPTGDTWYYGIHATGEFVSNGEWKQDGSSYYMDQAATKAITSDAFALLTAAADALTVPEAPPVWIDDLAAASIAKTDATNSLVTIEGKEFYKLAEKDGQALIISKEYVTIPTATTSLWKDSNVRAYLNNDYYNSLPASLKRQIVETTVSTYESWGNPSGLYTTQDKVFLLSVGDVQPNSSDDIRTATKECVFPAGESDSYQDCFIFPRNLITGEKNLLRSCIFGGNESYAVMASSVEAESTDKMSWSPGSSTAALPIMWVSVV